MDKRSLIKLCAVAVASPLSGRILAWAGQERLRNWAGNLEYDRVYTSASIEQVQERVKASNKLKVLGTRHCFNAIADSKDEFLSLRPMDKVIALDQTKRTVSVNAGITYGQLCPYLDAKGFALHNLASRLIFPWRAHAAPRPTARVKRTGTWRPQCLQWKWSRRTAR